MHKSVGYAELLHSKLRSDKLLARRDATRRAKLKAFLDQHQHASQWAQCVAALEDAALHNVVPSSAMISDAIQRCGMRRKLDVAKRLYTTFHREIQRPRAPQVHVSFMTACADCGDFAEAHTQFTQLRTRDEAKLAQNAQHRPVVCDELTAEYLRAALTASSSSSSSGGESPWSVALRAFAAIRHPDCPLRAHNPLTPVVLERLARLFEAAGDCDGCRRLLRACAAHGLLIPPEAHDAAVRLFYRHARHEEVVEAVRAMAAARAAPDERTVRLALSSCEEVAAARGRDGAPWDLALSLLDAMRRNGLALQQPCYEAPLRTCAMAGRWVEAAAVVERMKCDRRPVSAHLYRFLLAARVEACGSVAAAEAMARLPLMNGAGTVRYLALLRCCMRLGDWRAFDRVDREMRAREVPETFDKMRLLMEAAYRREQWHAVMMRFARFESVAGYEQRRVEKDGVVRMYPADFEVPPALLDMVINAYPHVRDHKDPLVHAAYRSALRRKEKGTPQVAAPTNAPPAEWMFSSQEREKSEAPRHH